MATTVSLTDGTTTINLNAATTTTIGTEWVRLPRLNRQYARVGAFPFVDGQRTIASGLSDTEIEIACHIRGATTDGVDAQFIALQRLLENALRWETHRTGAPVRLAWKRDGTTNTAYWTVRYGSVELNRDPEWLPAETSGNILHLLVRLVVEPTAHAGALTTIKAATTITNQPTLNYAVTSAATGDMPGPLSVRVTGVSVASAWTRAWVAICPQAPAAADYNNTADTNALGAASSQTNLAPLTPVLTIAREAALLTTATVPLRIFARIKVTAGTAANLRLQYYLTNSAAEFRIYGPWVAFAGTSGSYLLVDLGSVDTRALQQRAYQSSATWDVGVNAKVTTGSTVEYSLDYIELVPYAGLLYITDTAISLTRTLVYEAIGEAGTFYYPRSDIQTYTTTTSGVLANLTSRQGRLSTIPGGSAWYLWTTGQTATLHTIADTVSVVVEHLPCYSLGLRGAA